MKTKINIIKILGPLVYKKDGKFYSGRMGDSDVTTEVRRIQRSIRRLAELILEEANV